MDWGSVSYYAFLFTMAGGIAVLADHSVSLLRLEHAAILKLTVIDMLMRSICLQNNEDLVTKTCFLLAFALNTHPLPGFPY